MSQYDHDLFAFMQATSDEISAEYSRIQRRVLEDPGTARDQGEENWSTVIKDWLPSYYSVVTKGRILDHAGNASKQIDVLVLKPSYPRKLLDKKLYLASGVAAAFECKLTLTSEHVKSAFETCSYLKRLYPKRLGTPYKELHTPITYGLLAHSHGWKKRNSNPIRNIENQIMNSFSRVEHPRELLDIISVSDLGTWSSFIMAFLGPAYVSKWDIFSKIYGEFGCLTTSYIKYLDDKKDKESKFSALGSFVYSLIYKMAWNDPALRDFAEYCLRVGISGPGNGKQVRWPSTVYSDQVKLIVENGGLQGDRSQWSEWSFNF